MNTESVHQLISELQAAAGGKSPPNQPPLNERDPSGMYPSMETRVTRLETHMEYVQRDLKSIDGKLDTLLQRTQSLPSKSDLSTFRWQWVATAVAAIALIVGGIIGGLGWIKPDAAPASPIVVQMPTQAPPANRPRS